MVCFPREFDVLQALMQEPDSIFSRTELCGRLWHHEPECDVRTVEIFIARLRRKSGLRVRSAAHSYRSRGRLRPSRSGVKEPVSANERWRRKLHARLP